MIPKPVLFFIASLNLCCVPVTSGTVSRSLQRVGVNWPGEGFIVSFSFPRAETGKPQPNPSRNLFRCGPWAKNGFNVFQALYKKGFKRWKISIRGWQWRHELAVLRLREKQAGAKGVSACLFPGARPNFFRSSRELTYFQRHSMLAEKPFAFLSNRTNHWFANEPNDPNWEGPLISLLSAEAGRYLPINRSACGKPPPPPVRQFHLSCLSLPSLS